MIRTIPGLAPLALLVALAGCGQELTAGGQHGDVDAVVTDDPASPSPSLSPEPGGPRLSRSLALVPMGTVTLVGSVTLVTDQGNPEPLSQAAQTASLSIGSAGTTSLAQADVPAVNYIVARILFTKVEANVTGGLLLPGGIDLRGTVTVDLSEPVTVERRIALRVLDSGQHTLTIDVNAATWLVAVNPLTRTIPSAVFASAVTVRTN
jgi:hypothetical protein